MKRDGVTEMLTDARFELLPFEGFEEQVAHLPEGAKIAITASPKKGLEATLTRAVDLADRGYEVSAHVSARSVRDEDHLTDVADRLTDAGVDDVFVPGGDNEEPAGDFESAYELLVALDELGYSFEEVGITGYPEGHQFLDEETLADAMDRKAPYATYVITQLSFDPEAVVAWIENVRQRGVELPVHVGIPGVMNYQRLLNISRRIGVGDSIQFLHKTTGIVDFVRQIVGSRGKYTPDRLVEELAPYYADPDYGIDGVHLYTFNEVPDTESWRREVVRN